MTRLPNIIAGANSEARTFYQGYKASSESSVETLVSGAENLGDKPFWARAAMFPVTMFDPSKNTPMAFGLFSNTTAKIVIDNESPDAARVSAVSDQGAVFSYSVTNRTNRLSFGFNVRPVMRYAYEDRIPSEDLLNKDLMKARLEDDSNTSQGIGLDVGFLYTIADFWFPTLGVSILNLPTGCREEYLNPFTETRETVCGTSYSGDFGNEEAPSTIDPTDIRVGMAITPRVSRKLSMRLAVDAHHLAYASGTQSYGLQGIEASKLFHAGVELFYGNPLQLTPFAVRAGVSQGFATFGATVDLAFVAIEFASYGRDVSSGVEPREDRRYQLSLSVDL